MKCWLVNDGILMSWIYEIIPQIQLGIVFHPHCKANNPGVDHCSCFNTLLILNSKHESNKKNRQNQANPPTISKALTVTHGWPWTFTGFPTCQAKCQGDSSLSRDHFTSVTDFKKVDEWDWVLLCVTSCLGVHAILKTYYMNINI